MDEWDGLGSGGFRIFGKCPVQGFGITEQRQRWYFRARADKWSFDLAELPGEDPVDLMWNPSPISGWSITRSWMEPGGKSAGWMPERYARRLIAICLRWWQEGKLDYVEADSVGHAAMMKEFRRR